MLHLHSDRRMEKLRPVVPTKLVNMQLKSPLSSGTDNVNLSIDILPEVLTDIVGSDMLIAVLSLVHMAEGVGTPSKSHVKLTLSLRK